MIYAVNINTKQHRVYTDGLSDLPEGWKPVEADAEGWIEHEGGEWGAPVAGPYEAKLRDGRIVTNVWDWKGKGLYDSPRDVIAYRPILEDKERDMSEQEWDGDGLPGSGCKVEALDDDKWHEAEWLKYYNGAHAVFFIRSRALAWVDEIRPLRTAAQRAEDALAREMMDTMDNGSPFFWDAQLARAVYAAIRDGRIPGVKLEDEA